MKKQPLPRILTQPFTNESSHPTQYIDDEDVTPKLHYRSQVLSQVESNHSFENLILNQRRFKGHPYLNLVLYLSDIHRGPNQNEFALETGNFSPTNSLENSKY